MADYSITAVDRRVVYSGSAGTGPYAFTFPVLATTDIAVYKDSTKLVEGSGSTQYTVSLSASTGTGSVTLGAAATGSNTITITGARSIQRTTDFVTAGDLLASSLNTELDSQTIFVQQVSEDAGRAIKAPVTDPTSIDMTLPLKADRLGKFLSFNSSTGNPEVTVATTDVSGAAASATAAAASATAAASSQSSASSSASTATTKASEASASATAAAASAAAADGGGPGVEGTGTDEFIRMNANTITGTVTIPTGKNGFSGGPITIQASSSVTVSTGATWHVIGT